MRKRDTPAVGAAEHADAAPLSPHLIRNTDPVRVPYWVSSR